MHFKSCLMATMAAGAAMAHMNMKDPAPLNYKNNPNAKDADIDYSITSPITAAQFPCKGYLKELGTSEGASVKTYAPGEKATMSVEGSAVHNGGSCQLSLSYDKGGSFTVIKSFIGNCPTSNGQTFDFTVPSDAPEGDEVVFAWTWVNKTGNREFYMSCAVVSIKGGSQKRDTPINSKRDVAFSDRPKMFEANLGGKYCTKEGVDTVFPEPGPDVENSATNPGPAVLCGSGADAPEGDAGSGSGSDSGSGSGSSATTASAESSTTASASPPAAVTPTGGVFFTTEPASTASATAVPTTLSTATSAPATTSTAADNGGSATSAAPPTSSGAAATQSGACTDEGAWACSADGASFQRCASGQWSAAVPMASGTKCTPGVSDNLSMRRRRDLVRRSAGSWNL